MPPTATVLYQNLCFQHFDLFFCLESKIITQKLNNQKQVLWRWILYRVFLTMTYSFLTTNHQKRISFMYFRCIQFPLSDLTKCNCIPPLQVCISSSFRYSGFGRWVFKFFEATFSWWQWSSKLRQSSAFSWHRRKFR